jgi:hypothetical protein
MKEQTETVVVDIIILIQTILKEGMMIEIKGVNHLEMSVIDMKIRIVQTAPIMVTIEEGIHRETVLIEPT